MTAHLDLSTATNHGRPRSVPRRIPALLSFALGTVVALGAPLTASASCSSTSPTVMACIAQARRTDQLFGVALLGNPHYKVTELWLRVSKADGSKTRNLKHTKQNVEPEATGLFQFNPKDVKKKLEISKSKLLEQGFEIVLKFERASDKSTDECGVFSFRYNGTDWTVAKGANPDSSKFKKVAAGKRFTLVFGAAGAADGPVSCQFVNSFSAS